MNASPPQRLSYARFSATLRALGCRKDAHALHRQLLLVWSQRHRHYHVWQHLDECLALLDAWGVLLSVEYRAVLELAIWFHDAVYEPTSHTNEADSAEWARRALAELGVASIIIAQVVDLVRATDHRVEGVRSPMADLLLDIDLAILGAAPERFKEYEQQVRAEYAWVPEERYQEGRSALLAEFRARALGSGQPLYRTNEGRALLPQARENLA